MNLGIILQPAIERGEAGHHSRARANMASFGGEDVTMSADDKQIRDERGSGEPHDGHDPAALQQSGEPQHVEQPAEEAAPPDGRTPPVDKRAAIMEKFNARRDEERQVPLVMEDEYSAPFARNDAVQREAETLDENPDGDNKGGEPEREEPREAEPAQPQTQAPAAPETFELKVNGNTFRMTRDQMIAAAGLTPEEATDLPVTTIQRSAQIMEARKALLTEARDARNASRQQRDIPDQGRRAEEDEDHDEGEAGRDQQDPYLRAADRVQFGTPEEAAEALREVNRIENQNRDQRERALAITRETDTAVADFAKANADFDEDLHGVVFTKAMQEIKSDLIAVGFDEGKVHAIITTPERAAEFYREARLANLPVRSQAQILTSAAAAVRQRFLPNTVQQQRQDPPRVDTDARLAAKRTLPTQPTRAAPSAQATSTEAVQSDSRKNAVAEMQKRTGFGARA